MQKYMSIAAGVVIAGQMAWAGIMTAPQVFRIGEEGFLPENKRRIQMASSLAVSPGGRIWATWYAGPTANEDLNNVVVLATSGDDGATWQEVLVVDPDGPGIIRAYDPEIWLDPIGRVWLIWTQAENYGGNAQAWALRSENPDDEDAVWSEPFYIAPGVMMCKPTVLSEGSWLFPVSDWQGRMDRKPDAATGGAWVSTDQGQTFALRGAAWVPMDVRSFDEHMVVERKDGSLWMLLRTSYGLGESFSTDHGKTWTETVPSAIPHTPSRIFIRRLDSGNLLLVKHGSMKQVSGRSHLTALISKDDGKTWEGGLLLDERGGISYPDGQQAADGTIYITYDFSRTQYRTIHMASFTEDDVLAGKDVSGKVRLRMDITNPGLLTQIAIPPYEAGVFTLDDNQDGVELDPSTLTVLQPLADRAVDTLQIGAQVWSDRVYVFSVLPDVLQGKRFIRSDIGARGVQGLAERDGLVYVMSREGDAVNRLTQDGFEKVNIPAFIPYAPGDEFKPKDAYSVFQKNVRKGDVIKVNLWDIMVFAAE